MFNNHTDAGRRLRLGAFAFFCALIASFAPLRAETPDETYKALGLDKTASPKELYDALEKRYHDEALGAGKGSLSKYWEPIPISKYLNPHSFYKPPQTVDVDATRAQCVECHSQATPGWTHSWKGSVHGNLDEIRNLPDSDFRAYKKAMIKEVETNLQSMGKLKAGESLREVGCIDCHMGVGQEHGQHKAELKMPDAAACGQCHVQQFAERESERDTFTWPQDQWKPGHPSHALSYKANVENAIWAAMEQREVAEGCTFCHTPQTTCNSCHTRHEFSAVEARKPQACAQCHNGVDHNEFEGYMLSKHGTVYQTRGDSWDWNAQLSEALDKGKMTAPTCQFCHMEYAGKFTHNMVRKARWAFVPMPKIADNLNHPWFTQRKEFLGLDLLQLPLRQFRARLSRRHGQGNHLGPRHHREDPQRAGEALQRQAAAGPEDQPPGAAHAGEGRGRRLLPALLAEGQQPLGRRI